MQDGHAMVISSSFVVCIFVVVIFLNDGSGR